MSIAALVFGSFLFYILARGRLNTYLALAQQDAAGAATAAGIPASSSGGSGGGGGILGAVDKVSKGAGIISKIAGFSGW
jgi:hypothetical protein